MPKKTKKQLNAEFLEKIKTITVGTGAKPSSDPICSTCHEPLSHHVIKMKLVAVGGVMKTPPKPEPKRNEEVAFAA
jgi:hypothetical protein